MKGWIISVFLAVITVSSIMLTIVLCNTYPVVAEYVKAIVFILAIVFVFTLAIHKNFFE